MLELIQGKLSNQVMGIVADRDQGLFPKPSEIKLSCSCPDWATMCKHVEPVVGAGQDRDQLTGANMTGLAGHQHGLCDHLVVGPAVVDEDGKRAPAQAELLDRCFVV